MQYQNIKIFLKYKTKVSKGNWDSLGKAKFIFFYNKDMSFLDIKLSHYVGLDKTCMSVQTKWRTQDLIKLFSFIACSTRAVDLFELGWLLIAM